MNAYIRMYVMGIRQYMLKFNIILQIVVSHNAIHCIAICVWRGWCSHADCICVAYVTIDFYVKIAVLESLVLLEC